MKKVILVVVLLIFTALVFFSAKYYLANSVEDLTFSDEDDPQAKNIDTLRYGIPNLEVKLIPNQAHGSWMGKPDLVNPMILAFIKKH